MNSNIETVLELEDILLRFDQIRDLLLMLADCALESVNPIDQYSDGVNLIATLLSDNTNELHILFDKAYPKANKSD